MNGAKNRPGLLQEEPIRCYRVWMKPKVAKKTDRHGPTLLGQFLRGTKPTLKS